MARDVINITGESGRNIIDDDAESTLELKNTNAAGTGLLVTASTSGGKGIDVDVTGTGAGLDVDVTGSGAAAELTSSTGKAVTAQGAAISTFQSSATAVGALEVSHLSTIVSSVTVAPFKVISSAASGPLIDFGVIDSGAVVSAATSGPTLMGQVRVKIGNQYGWIDIKESL